MKDKTVRELKLMVLAGQDAVNCDCFGTKDLLRAELAARELERRGYEITESKVTHFVKRG